MLLTVWSVIISLPPRSDAAHALFQGGCPFGHTGDMLATFPEFRGISLTGMGLNALRSLQQYNLVGNIFTFSVLLN